MKVVNCKFHEGHQTTLRRKRGLLKFGQVIERSTFLKSISCLDFYECNVYQYIFIVLIVIFIIKYKKATNT